MHYEAKKPNFKQRWTKSITMWSGAALPASEWSCKYLRMASLLVTSLLEALAVKTFAGLLL